MTSEVKVALQNEILDFICLCVAIHGTTQPIMALTLYPHIYHTYTFIGAITPQKNLVKTLALFLLFLVIIYQRIGWLSTHINKCGSFQDRDLFTLECFISH